MVKDQVKKYKLNELHVYVHVYRDILRDVMNMYLVIKRSRVHL